jgi:hypothetical protein
MISIVSWLWSQPLLVSLKSGASSCCEGATSLCFRLREDAELPELLVEVGHILGHARMERAEVVVVELLSLGRPGSEERAARVAQVLALFVELAVDQEILLLRAHSRVNALGARVAEEPQDAQSLHVEHLDGAQQRRFLVEHLAAVGTEDGRDAERVFFYKGIGSRVPGRVAARFKGGAQAAGREGGRVRLALDELAAGELHDDLAVVQRRNEAVVLFGRDAGHGLEPVRVMSRALLHRPVLHGVGDNVRYWHVELSAFGYAFFKSLVGVLRETLLHDLVVEDHAAEQFRNIYIRVAHCRSSCR